MKEAVTRRHHTCTTKPGSSARTLGREDGEDKDGTGVEGEGGGASHHVALVHLWTHGELHDEPGGVPQDEGGDQVPMDDVPQTADAPGRPETDWL